MVINWIHLAVGLVFGLLPPMRLLNCECRFLIFDEMWARVCRRGTGGERRRRWWKLPLVWIDPFRGYVVGASLAEAFERAPGATFIQGQLPVLSLLACVMAVMAVQTSGRDRERESLSPGGFMAGIMLAMMPLQIAISAIVIGAATAMALHSYTFGYLAAGLATAGVGAVFMMGNTKLGIYVLMTSAPAWLSWLRGTTLVTPVRC
jgi:hypothetical protein